MAALVDHIENLQHPSQSSFIICFLAWLNSHTKFFLNENRAIFNQIRLSYRHPWHDDTTPTPTIVPTGFKTVSSPIRPTAPNHIGELSDNPLHSNWKEALFSNYDKMQHTGMWSAPILHTYLPNDQLILWSRVKFHIKDISTPNTYELQGRTCADGSKIHQYIGFLESYSPVGSIDSIRIILAYSASSKLMLNILDISNVFQSSVIFEPLEHTYLSIPPWYLDWFHHTWPDYKLPSDDPSQLTICEIVASWSSNLIRVTGSYSKSIRSRIV